MNRQRTPGGIRFVMRVFLYLYDYGIKRSTVPAVICKGLPNG